MKAQWHKSLRGIFAAMLFAGTLMSAATQEARAQWAIMRADADSLLRVGTDQIYNLQFTDAEQNFAKVRELYPDHPASYFMDAMVDWWRLKLDTKNKSFEESFLSKIGKTIEVSDKLLEQNDKDITGLFFKGGALGYRGRFYAENQRWVKAADDGKTGLDILIACQKIAPGNHDILLGTGLYNYLSVALSEQYPVLSTVLFFLPKGDKSLGLLQLRAASNKARYASTEAKVVLQQIYYQFEKNTTEAFNISQELATKYPQNPYFQRYYGRTLVQMGLGDQWEQTWREILKRCFANQYGYDKQTAREALYYVGLSLMNKGEYDDALKYFYKCDEASRALDQDPTGFMVMTNMKIGNIYDIQGKRDLAKSQYQKVLSWREVQNSHASAEQYMQSAYSR